VTKLYRQRRIFPAASQCHTVTAVIPVSLPWRPCHCPPCCWPAATDAAWQWVSKGVGAERHWVNNGRAQIAASWLSLSDGGEVLIESRPRLLGAAISISDRTLDVLIDHLRD